MIELDGLTLASRGTTLGPLTLRLDDGVTGVVGPSGAGKTLLLLTLAGLLPRAIAAGRARSDGPVAMVFANDALDDGASALGNVVDAAHAARVADAVTRSVELLTALGLDAAMQQRAPRFLSGGQRKRVGIARALVIRPRTLLLDDATAGLDPLTAADVVDLVVAHVARLPGACALFATQDVDTVLPRLAQHGLARHGLAQHGLAQQGAARALRLHAPAAAGPRSFSGSVVDVADVPAPFAPRASAPFLVAPDLRPTRGARP